MMLDFVQLIKKYNITPRGVIQLGVHWFQEKEVLQSLGINDFVLVEPQKAAFEIMKERAKDVNAILYNCAVSEFEGKAIMKCDETNQGQSSSLLEAKEHLIKYPSIQFTREEEVDVKKIVNLVFEREKYNILVMDLQGGELKALLGSSDLLDYIDCIYTEVNFIEMYKGCVLIETLDAFLNDFYGFTRVETGENYQNQGWSDAFYVRK